MRKAKGGTVSSAALVVFHSQHQYSDKCGSFPAFDFDLVAIDFNSTTIESIWSSFIVSVHPFLA